LSSCLSVGGGLLARHKYKQRQDDKEKFDSEAMIPLLSDSLKETRQSLDIPKAIPDDIINCVERYLSQQTAERGNENIFSDPRLMLQIEQIIQKKGMAGGLRQSQIDELINDATRRIHEFGSLGQKMGKTQAVSNLKTLGSDELEMGTVNVRGESQVGILKLISAIRSENGKNHTGEFEMDPSATFYCH